MGNIVYYRRVNSGVDESTEGREEAAKERTQDRLRRTHFQMKLTKYMDRVRLYDAAWEAHWPLTSIDEFIPES
jgi:hypothetical protein